VVADARQVEERQALDGHHLGALLGRERVQVGVVGGVDLRATEVVVPVGAGGHVERLAGEQRDGPRTRLVVPLRRAEELPILIGPGLVVVVDARLGRVVEDVRDDLGLAGGAQGELLIGLLPPSPVALLVLPAGGVAGTGLGLDVVPPHVLGSLALGPQVLAGHAARVAPDALVEVDHHRDL